MLRPPLSEESRRLLQNKRTGEGASKRTPEKGNAIVLKLENVPAEQMPQIVHIATELQEQDRQVDAETQERQATVAAAEEMGLPEKYLHQAASELHTRRVAQIELRRRRRVRLLSVGAAVATVGMLGGLLLFHPQVTAPPAPPVATVVQTPAPASYNAPKPVLKTNAGTQASVSIENGAATIKVQKFVPDAAGRYYANLNAPLDNSNLSGYHATSFHVHGTMPHVRLYLENGQGERWRSPEFNVQSSEQIVRVDFSQFEHQLRQPDGVSWRNVRFEPPTTVENTSFKLGSFVNDANAAGEVTLSDLKFE